MSFKPDYMNMVKAARNERPDRLPLYEHIISTEIMEEITGEKFSGDIDRDNDRYFSHYCEFFRRMGYDTVSYEECVNAILPGGGALGGHIEGCIKTMADLMAYPWDKLGDIYFDRFSPHFEALGRNMPQGMKAVGGVGNGVFECVQDLTGYMNLCYISADDEDLYRALFERAGELISRIWERFLREFGDIYCVCRFGDDLGFNTATLLSGEDIRELIIPQYRRVTDIVHAAGKPFLLHSCGCIFSVMDDLIDNAGIDAKHSNEDSIAPFVNWIDRYGDRIGNFGGIDTDVLCKGNTTDIESYIRPIYGAMRAKEGGAAIGSGNSIPSYVSAERYLTAVNFIRRLRKDDVK